MFDVRIHPLPIVPSANLSSASLPPQKLFVSSVFFVVTISFRESPPVHPLLRPVIPSRHPLCHLLDRWPHRIRLRISPDFRPPFPPPQLRCCWLLLRRPNRLSRLVSQTLSRRPHVVRLRTGHHVAHSLVHPFYPSRHRPRQSRCESLPLL